MQLRNIKWSNYYFDAQGIKCSNQTQPSKYPVFETLHLVKYNHIPGVSR